MAKLTRAQLLERRSALTEQTSVSVSPTSEAGVSGTTNWGGRIHAESNAKLRWEKAYGQSGQTTWGEWEKLHRTDHCVASALAQLAAPIRDAEARVEVPKSIRDAAEKEAKTSPTGPAQDEQKRLQAMAEFCQDNLSLWLEPRLPTVLEQVITYGLGYGFSLHEVVWGSRPDERVAGGQAVILRKLAQRLPSSVKQDGWKEENGELAYIEQSGVKDGRWLDNVKLPADKVLLATWARSGNNYAGFSAFRAGWYMAQQRAELLRILGIKHQREACGAPVASIDKDASLTSAQLDELQTVLEGLTYHENAAIVLPPGVTLEWVFSPGATNNAPLETWKALGTAIYELVQAQQTSLGTSDTGNRAVGEVHAKSQGTFVAGVRSWVEAAFNGIGSQPYTGIIRKLVDLNFGPQRIYPEFRLVLDEAEEDAAAQSSWAGAIKTASDAGALTLTPSDEEAVRERLGLPKPSAEELATARTEQQARRDATNKAQMSFSELLGEP